MPSVLTGVQSSVPNQSLDAAASAKLAAATLAVDEFVHSNELIGIGTGSTSTFAIIHLAEKVQRGELTNITCVATSLKSQEECISRGLQIIDVDEIGARDIDVAIDGADEIDVASWTLIKGRGGALFREKLVEEKAKLFVCIADETKLVQRLGKGVLPVEVCPFGWKTTRDRICKALEGTGLKSCEVRREPDGSHFVTDNHHYILHLQFDKGLDAKEIHSKLVEIVGVVEHGLFIDMDPQVVIGKPDATAYVLHRS